MWLLWRGVHKSQPRGQVLPPPEALPRVCLPRPPQPLTVDSQSVNKNSPTSPGAPENGPGYGYPQMTTYLAILKDDKRTVVIEFVPLLDSPAFEPFFTGIEIVSVDIQQIPHTWAEQRAAYQASPSRPKPPHQPGLFDDQK